jgi:6,7-dimethyl-8-ribityllumazine synthase
MNQTLDTSPSSNRPAPAGARPRLGKRRIAIVCSLWHADVVARARDALEGELASRGIARARIDRVEVPGAFEIPLAAQRLARSGSYAAIVACGFVVDGGIYRHDFVAAAVIDGLMRVMLDTDVPVLSVVLTPQAFHEHEQHRRFFEEHMVTKGREAASACLAVLRAAAPSG